MAVFIKPENDLIADGTSDMMKVLVVDEDSVVSATLSEMGLSVSEAINGEQALANAREQLPDLILLNERTPGMASFDVLEQLKQSQATRSIQVVMVTGSPSAEGEAQAMKLGVPHYMMKPLNVDMLKKTVRVALREGLAARAEESDVSDLKDQVIRTGGKLTALEAKMDGGVPLNTLTIIEGAASAGKSVLSQHLAFGALADGHGTAYFTSEHTAKSLVTQMESIGLGVSEYLPNKLQIYALAERDESENPESLLSVLAQHLRQLTSECEFIIIDAITALASPCPEWAVIDFFTSCKRLCAQGKTIVLTVDSYAFGSEMFARLGTLCDSYLCLRSERVREKSVRTLEARKVNTIELSRDNMISFVVEPKVGMNVIPFSKTKA